MASLGKKFGGFSAVVCDSDEYMSLQDARGMKMIGFLHKSKVKKIVFVTPLNHKMTKADNDAISEWLDTVDDCKGLNSTYWYDL